MLAKLVRARLIEPSSGCQALPLNSAIVYRPAGLRKILPGGEAVSPCESTLLVRADQSNQAY